MAKWRKKPVVVEAVQVTENGYGALKDSGIYDREDVTVFHQTVGDTNTVTYFISHAEIETLEGTMRADLGDWIIVGVNGEAYPCKPEIFSKTYVAADEDEFEAYTVEIPEVGAFLLMLEDGEPSIVSGPIASIEFLVSDLDADRVTRLRCLTEGGYRHWVKLSEGEHFSAAKGMDVHHRHRTKKAKEYEDRQNDPTGEASS